MNWNQLAIDELLDQVKDLEVKERETILNDYIIDHYEYLNKIPLKMLPLLELMYQTKEALSEKEATGTEDYENLANDCVFLALWMAKIHLNEEGDEEGCREWILEADLLLKTYTGQYVGELRSENMKNLKELNQRLESKNTETTTEDTMEKETNMPKQFEEYLELLKKKRLYQLAINKNVGQNRHYGYLFTGNKGTGKRTSAKMLFEALRAVNDEVKTWVEIPAAQLFEPSNGFASIDDTLNNNKNRRKTSR